MSSPFAVLWMDCHSKQDTHWAASPSSVMANHFKIMSFINPAKLEKVESVRKISMHTPLTGSTNDSDLSVHLLSGFAMPPVSI